MPERRKALQDENDAYFLSQYHVFGKLEKDKNIPQLDEKQAVAVFHLEKLLYAPKKKKKKKEKKKPTPPPKKKKKKKNKKKKKKKNKAKKTKKNKKKKISVQDTTGKVSHAHYNKNVICPIVAAFNS